MPRHPHFHCRHREFATFPTLSNQQQCLSGSTPLSSCPSYRTPERKKTNETAPTALSPREPAPSSAQVSWPGPRSDSGHRRRSRGCWGWCLVSRSRRNCRGRCRWELRGLSGLTRRDDFFLPWFSPYSFTPLPLTVYWLFWGGAVCDVMWYDMV